MPNITFSSPMHKDKTVYAVAGSHRDTVLKLAKDNHIPIDFGCENGECGTCLVKTQRIDKKHGPMGAPLTDDEIKVLKERIQVLERITTENNRALDLDREIEKLR